ncbi:MAG: HDIG domain-containing metalloprotein [Promethearchaeota archaeon]
MGNEEVILPDREYAIQLLKELKVPFQIRKHSLKVAEKALEIANRIKKAGINKDLVEIGAIFHDIGRAKTHGFDHGIIGGRILKNRGFPDCLARICQTHVLGGLDREDAKKYMKNIKLPKDDQFIPSTLEEKIVCLSDKYLKGTKEVSLENRFEIWFKKYGRSEILLKSKKRVVQIQKEIESLM